MSNGIPFEKENSSIVLEVHEMTLKKLQPKRNGTNKRHGKFPFAR